MIGRFCKNCEFWDTGDWSVNCLQGDCRRHAPQAFYAGNEPSLILAMRSICASKPGDEEGIEAARARWPWTSAYDYCGEFKLREEQDEIISHKTALNPDKSPLMGPFDTEVAS